MPAALVARVDQPVDPAAKQALSLPQNCHNSIVLSARLEVGIFAGLDRDGEARLLVDSLQQQEDSRHTGGSADPCALLPLVGGDAPSLGARIHSDDRHDSISRNTERPIALAFML